MNEPLCETVVCPRLEQCHFIRENQIKMPELVARTQHNYCTQSAHSRCARFYITQLLGTEAVPSLMLPSQFEWAQQVIEEFGNDLEKDGQLSEV
jgi:hypothetical protein